MAVMRLIGEALTDVGRERDHNEDNFVFVPEEGLWVVCDGMGGHSSGEVASQMTADEVRKFVCETRHTLGVPVSGDARTPAEISLAEAIKTANERVFFRSCREKQCEGMGTTVVAVLDVDDDIVCAHVGDSRIYRLRDGVFSQVTEDHSLLNHLRKTKGMSDEEASTFEGKNVILRAVGLRDDVTVDTQVQPKLPGDIYLLCSDGLTDMVRDEVIAQILAANQGDLATGCRLLVDAANENGGHDNVTVMLVRVMVEIPPPPPSRPLPPVQV